MRALIEQTRQADRDDDDRSLTLGAQAVAQAAALGEEDLLLAAIEAHASAITFQGQDPPTILAVLNEHMARLPGAGPAVQRTRAWLKDRLAFRLLTHGDADAALGLVNEVAATAEALHDHELRVAARLTRAQAQHNTREREQAAEQARTAWTLAQGRCGGELQIRLLNFLALNAAARGAAADEAAEDIRLQFYDEARQWREQALALESTHPHRRWRRLLQQNQAADDNSLGRHQQARDRLDAMDREPGPPPSIRRQAQRWRLYGDSFADEGRHAEAIAPLRKALALTVQLQEWSHQIELHDHLTACFETLGDLASALAEARAARQLEARLLQDQNQRREQMAQLRMQIERTRAEAELAQQHAQALEAVNHQLRLAQDEAQAATRAKSEFLANMSHEIRTPMTAVIGMTQLALRTGLDERQRGYLNNVERAGQALLHIINDILDFSKIEASRLDIEALPFELVDLLDQLTMVVGLQAEQQGLELLFAVDPALPRTLIGDPLRLGQVLINLAGNAVKFTPQGEVTLRIELRACTDNAAQLHFCVQDTGIGISAEQQQRLFHAFAQGDSSTARRHGGTGLGLVICQRLVQLMGGTLTLESTPGAGSRFMFTLTLGVPAQAEAQVPPNLNSVRLLLADDNDSARLILHEMAESLQMQVDSVADGAEALALFAQARHARRPYDLVLLDWNMPDMDGVACAQHLLLGQQDHTAPPILMATAHGREDLRQRLNEVGLPVGAVLAKPVTPSTLFDAVSTALQRPALVSTRANRHACSLDHHRRRLAGTRLLLVEDNPLNQVLATELLEDAGAHVTLADNGREAIAHLEAAAFDLVLMDCQMPVLDGYEATRELRRQPRWADLPIIAMTANAMAGDRDKALAAGMNDHLAKPIDIELLYATVARWLTPLPDA